MRPLAILIINIFALSMSAYAQDIPIQFSVKSERAVIGQYPRHDVTFSSVLEESGVEIWIWQIWGQPPLSLLLPTGYNVCSSPKCLTVLAIQLSLPKGLLLIIDLWIRSSSDAVCGLFNQDK